ncbi:AI-2E family transporter [Granulosicoccus antarcticus]|uniref:AI-2 transport protein TqsA n=1 Tax=Granulosicoccus antarcticus IMCC3135 TaxID=1192854 RepID=A0A2Z2NR45_9GAMM|nr:AI-2E family transporter [Granulosicoccus antarcticus]ASJ72965.1 AI-2 transport protein TqsA [Granulosicoccus antarcticus IMCC3135]
MDIDSVADNTRLLRSIKRILFIHLIFAIAVICYFGKDLLLPLALGLLITLTLAPAVRWLSRYRVPAPVSAVMLVLIVGGFITSLGYMLATPMTELFDSIPHIGETLEKKLSPYQTSVDAISKAGKQVEDIASAGGEQPARVVLEQPGIITSAASTVANGLTTIMLAFVLSLFMLASGTLFQEKLISVMPRLQDKKRALSVAYSVESSVSRYLLTVSLINIGLGVAITIALSVLGVTNAVLWGVVAAVLNFLPFAGALIGAGLLAIVSLGTYDTLAAALIPPIVYFSCTTIEGNFITPAIVGRRLQLNIVAVFLAVVIWGWLWGIGGALMAVPILLVIKVLCDHIETWKDFGEFLSGREAAIVADEPMA